VYREILNRLCIEGLYRACRFRYVPSERFAKYVLALFETYQLLESLAPACIDDEECVAVFVDMLMSVAEAEPYEFIIDPKRVKRVLRRLDYLRYSSELN